MNSIDLSMEFNRQFWGDVMLFSIEKLAEIAYPDSRVGLSVITEISYALQDKLWNLYKKRQTEIAVKKAKIESYISQEKFWWNREARSSKRCKEHAVILFCG